MVGVTVGARVVGDHDAEAERELLVQVRDEELDVVRERRLLVEHGDDDIDRLQVGVHLEPNVNPTG
jgi:hypothetical protein